MHNLKCTLAIWRTNGNYGTFIICLSSIMPNKYILDTHTHTQADIRAVVGLVLSKMRTMRTEKETINNNNVRDGLEICVTISLLHISRVCVRLEFKMKMNNMQKRFRALKRTESTS